MIIQAWFNWFQLATILGFCPFVSCEHIQLKRALTMRWNGTYIIPYIKSLETWFYAFHSSISKMSHSVHYRHVRHCQVCVIFVWGCELIIWLLAILPRGLSVQGVFESPQHEITTKYEFQISQSTKGKFDQSNGLAFFCFCRDFTNTKEKKARIKRSMCKMNLQRIFQVRENIRNQFAQIFRTF